VRRPVLIRPLLGVVTALLTVACSPHVHRDDRARVEAYSAIHFKDRLDEVLTREPRIPPAVAAYRARRAAPGAWREYRGAEAAEDSPRAMPRDLGALAAAPRTATVTGRVVAAARTGTGDVRDVVISDGTELFTVADSLARQDLFNALGADVEVQGRVTLRGEDRILVDVASWRRR